MTEWLSRLSIKQERVEALLMVLAGMVSALGFPPNPNPLPMILGLAVFLRMVETTRPRRGAWLGFCFGVAHFGFGITWLWTSLYTYGKLPGVVAFLLMVGLASILAGYPALFGALMPRLASRPWLMPLAAPALWVVTEWLRAHLFSGFPWNLLGYVWDASDTIMQAADLGGVYLLSWLTVFLASVLAVLARREALRREVMLVGIGLSVGILGLAFGYGHFRLQGLEEALARDIQTPPMRMALIQGNIAQDVKWDPARQEEWLKRYLDLSSELTQPADLVIWPETAAAFFLQFAPKELARLIDLSRGLETPILTGTPMADRDANKELQYFNSMVMIHPNENGKLTHRYDKHHLVPYGEYIPLRSLAPSTLHKLTHGSKDFTSGVGSIPMPWESGAIGGLICYEVIFPDEVRMLAVRGARWLINLTNDGWFGESAKPQHLAMARMRAVENRLPMIRVANSGISAVFNHLGTELGRIPSNQHGALVVSVSQGVGDSVWVRTGQLWIWLWLSVCMISWLLTRIQPQRNLKAS
ncbi:MAG: apolipoprotein N-acyltransferase [Magnetococcus sp. YQC-5]